MAPLPPDYSPYYLAAAVIFVLVGVIIAAFNLRLRAMTLRRISDLEAERRRPGTRTSLCLRCGTPFLGPGSLCTACAMQR